MSRFAIGVARRLTQQVLQAGGQSFHVAALGLASLAVGNLGLPPQGTGLSQTDHPASRRRFHPFIQKLHPSPGLAQLHRHRQQQTGRLIALGSKDEVQLLGLFLHTRQQGHNFIQIQGKTGPRYLVAAHLSGQVVVTTSHADGASLSHQSKHAATVILHVAHHAGIEGGLDVQLLNQVLQRAEVSLTVLT